MNIPSKEEALEILNNNNTPSNVIEHCKAVCEVAEELVEKITKKGIEVNKDLVVAAALLHDVERHKDNHIIQGENLLKKLGFSEVAEVIKKHSLYQMEKVQPKTVEEKIVFYADKRVKGSEVVSLEKRFEDLKKRYNVDFKNEFEFCKKIEKELLE
jgi:putative nucleotidyltransferase with HDIG domain